MGYSPRGLKESDTTERLQEEEVGIVNPAAQVRDCCSHPPQGFILISPSYEMLFPEMCTACFFTSARSLLR